MLRSFVGRHLRLQTRLGGLSRLHPGSAARCARGAGGARRAGLYYGSRSLQGRLVRRSEKSTAIRARIVDELPLIVVVLLVKDPYAFLFACAGYSNHGTAAEDLPARSATRLPHCAERAGRAGARRRAVGALARRRWSITIRIFV
jgi:hypothetical protein